LCKQASLAFANFVADKSTKGEKMFAQRNSEKLRAIRVSFINIYFFLDNVYFGHCSSRYMSDLYAFAAKQRSIYLPGQERSMAAAKHINIAASGPPDKLAAPRLF
jgi:hypothetical protein